MVLTCAFMYPEPPSDTAHPWLWSNFGASPAEAGAKSGEDFTRNILRGDSCRRQSESVEGVEAYGRDGVRVAGEWQGLGGREGDKGICWNVSGARRWFKPVVLNLAKDKRILYQGSDKFKALGLHRQVDEL